MFRHGGVSDLVLLDRVTEEAIIDTLNTRLRKEVIYTYIGAVLISVNPFKRIQGLYGPSQIEQYRNRYIYENAPHCYAIAEQAFKDLLGTGKNQAMIISGESGAGKTEAAKIALEHISSVSASNSKLADAQLIKNRLLQSNPLLEAFGNAKTLRNDNSSRFGKYLRILFDYGGAPIGGVISNYLLEKPRVVGQVQQDERCYHIFYQMTSSPQSPELRELQLQDAENYAYLAQTGCFRVRGMNDSQEWTATLNSFREVGMPDEEIDSVLRLTAAVVTLGNVDFEPAGEGSRITHGTSSETEWVSFYLNVDKAELERALVNRTIDVHNDRVTKPLRPEEAAATRDALAKALYARNFSAIVDTLNRSLYVDQDNALSIGVLDIYGFEIFGTDNSFEQLCINFANEKLQQLFIELTLKREQEEYAREGIPWEDVDYFNNKIVVDLIEARRPAGVLAYLDEESIIPEGTDITFHGKLGRNIQHPHFTLNGLPQFTISHYAGDVVYSVHTFLDKNKDTLFHNLVRLMGTSKDQRIQGLFPEARAGRDLRRPPTAGHQFKEQMNHLVNTLQECDPHYIRCIKSNEGKRAGVFERELVTNQVRYLGLLENVRVRRAGYAYRQTFQYFWNRYRVCSSILWPFGTGDVRADINSLFDEIGISNNEYAWGQTKIFVRRPQVLFSLEELRERKLNDLAIVIQKAYRAYFAIRWYLELKKQAQGIFQGAKRRNGSVFLQFRGDYIQASENTTLLMALAKAGEERPHFVFADQVERMNRKGRIQPWTLCITSQNFYLLSGPLHKCVVKTREPLQSLGGVALSTMADNWIFFHFPARTEVFSSFHKAELVTVLSRHLEDNFSTEMPLNFSDTIEFLTPGRGLLKRRTPVTNTCTFVEAPEAPIGDTAVEFVSINMTVRVHPKLCSDARFQLTSRLSRGTTQRAAANIAAAALQEAGGSGVAVRSHAARGGGETSAYGGGGYGGGGGGYSGGAGRGGGGARPGPGQAPDRSRAGGGKRPGPPRQQPVFKAPPPPTRTTRSRKSDKATVLYDFDGADQSEVSARAGDVVNVLEKRNDGWWLVSFEGETGLFPENYLRMVHA